MVYIVHQIWYSLSMNPKTLYNYFHHAVKFNNDTEIHELRIMVQDTVGIWNKMPDKTLLAVFRHKLFNEKLIIPPDKKEKFDLLTEHFMDFEDLFEL